MLTSCDRCGFDCDACFVSGAWEFLCDLCKAIEAAELEMIVSRKEARTVTVTRTFHESHEYMAEKTAALVAFESTMARARTLLASLARNTAALASK